MERINCRASDKMRNDIQTVAAETSKSMSKVMREALYHGLPEVADLQEKDRRYYNEKQKEIEEQTSLYLIERKYKKLDWQRYLKQRVREWYNLHGFTPDEILELLELHEDIAEVRGKEDMLQRMMSSIEEGNFDYAMDGDLEGR